MGGKCNNRYKFYSVFNFRYNRSSFMTKREKILERALEIASESITRGDCGDCPIKNNKRYCTEWTGKDDCPKQVIQYLISKATKEAK